MTYDPEPRYPVSAGEVELGFEPLVAEQWRRGASVIALDGPAAAPWQDLVRPLAVALGAEPVDVRDLRAPLAERLRPPGEAICFVNDADAFVLGEWRAGAARGRRRVVAVTLGTSPTAAPPG